MANEAIPYFDPADTSTCYVEAAVTGKRFVAISGPRVDGLAQVSPATAHLDSYGIACRDAATAGKVMVAHIGVWPVVADGAITAGDAIAVGATGKAIVASAGDVIVGTALDDAADAADVPVRLNVGSGGGSAFAVLTTEQVQDIVGAMFTGNTETGITVTYQDSDGTIDLVVG